MDDPVALVLVGIVGYGEVYLSALLDEPWGTQCKIVGAVDPSPHNCSRLGELQDRGVPIYSSLDSFYATNSADLAVISSPGNLARLDEIRDTARRLAHPRGLSDEEVGSVVVD